MDPFVIYDDVDLKYSLVRECVNEETRGKRFHTLDKITKVSKIICHALLAAN